MYSILKLTAEKISNIDLIITTLDINNLNKPVVKISSLLNTKDYQNIIQAYANYVLNKPSNYLEKSSHYPSIAKFVTPDLIQLNVEITNKTECLELLIAKLEALGYVHSNYRNSVLHREEIGDTSIENGIALPHGSPMFVSKSSISMMTLNKPIKWGMIDVSIIIMVSLSEKNINNINDVFTEIYEIVTNKQIVSDLKSVTSFEQLKIFLDNQ